MRMWGRVLHKGKGLGAGTVPGAVGRSQRVEGGCPILREDPWDSPPSPDQTLCLNFLLYKLRHHTRARYAGVYLT